MKRLMREKGTRVTEEWKKSQGIMDQRPKGTLSWMFRTNGKDVRIGALIEGLSN